MRLTLPLPQKNEESIWQALREGYAYLKRTPKISSLIILIAVYSLIVIPYSTLLPVFAKDVFQGNATVFGWFESITGLGALAGSVYIAGLQSSKKMIGIVILASLIFSLGMLCLALSGKLFIAIFFAGVIGLGMMSFTAAVNTFIQTHVEENMRGRIISYFIMAYQGVLPIGSLLAGALAGALGARITVALQAVAGVCATLIFLYYKKSRPPARKWRNRNHPH
jgi:MFS family permease